MFRIIKDCKLLDSIHEAIDSIHEAIDSNIETIELEEIVVNVSLINYVSKHMAFFLQLFKTSVWRNVFIYKNKTVFVCFNAIIYLV